MCFVGLPLVWVGCSAAFPCSPQQVSVPRVSVLPPPCGSDSWDKCLLTRFCRGSFSQHPFFNPVWFAIHLSKSRRCSNHAGFLRCSPKFLYLSKQVAPFAISASAVVLTSHETFVLMWRPKGTADNWTPCCQILYSDSFHTGNSESSSQVAQADPQLEICWRCTLKAPLDLSVVWNLLCIHHHEHRGLGAEMGSNEGAFRDLLLGSAVGLAQASNTAFASTDQEPFQHRIWCCPVFRTSFHSLPSPPYHFKSSINAVCYQCPSPSKTSVGSFGSAEVVVPYLWRHLNFWLLSSAFLQIADIQFQST